MRFDTRRPRNLVVSGPELLGVGATALTFSLWVFAARGAADPGVVPFFLAFSYVCTLAGRLCLGAVFPGGPRPDFPTTFLFGFFCASAAVFFLSLATPLGIAADGLAVALAVAAWGLLSRAPRRPAGAAAGRAGAWPGLAGAAVSLVAGTLWSAESIRPVVADRGAVVFRPWSDHFVHSCMVRMFRDAHGAATLEHVMLPGRPAQVYHYASYAAPALLAAVTETPCYLALSSFQVPLGVVLTGLAAYALVRSWWGPGAGLAAVVALLLLPDASSYGVGNPFLGFHWLEQVVPAAPYGVALAAVGWLLVFEGCRTRSPRVVLLGFAASGLVLAYKAHVFVANALLVWAAPPLLAPGVRPLRRAGWLLAAVGSFLAVASLSRYVPSAPALRLDGSGLKPYANQLAFNLADGPVKRWLSVTPTSGRLPDLSRGVVHLFLGTFGVFGPACLALIFPALARGAGGDPPGAVDPPGEGRARAAVALFPAAVVVNYLVMSLGLAPDDRSATTSDELMHRPLVWAYFVVAAWSGGAAYRVAARRGVGRSRFARTMLPVALAGSMAVPLVLGAGVQVGPGWGKGLTYTRMPVGLFRCAEFLRGGSRRGDLVLDSGRDPDMAFGALSERPEFVVDYWDGRKKGLLAGRLEDARALERVTDPGRLARDAAGLRVRWYVLRPGHRVGWPASFLDAPAFEAGGYRVYRLPRPAG